LKCNIYYFYAHIEPNHRSISVHLVHFSPFQSISVNFGSFWYNSVYFSLFGSTLVHFHSLQPFQSVLVKYDPLWSIWSN